MPARSTWSSASTASTNAGRSSGRMPSRKSPRSTMTSTWCRRPRAAAAASSAVHVSSSLASERSNRRTVSAASSGAGARKQPDRRRDARGAVPLGVRVPRLAERDRAPRQHRPADLGRAAGALRHRDDVDAAQRRDDVARVRGDLAEVRRECRLSAQGPPVRPRAWRGPLHKRYAEAYSRTSGGASTTAVCRAAVWTYPAAATQPFDARRGTRPAARAQTTCRGCGASAPRPHRRGSARAARRSRRRCSHGPRRNARPSAAADDRRRSSIGRREGAPPRPGAA